jgi:D-serine deaminase-like pyridoxal phosphate-dependent protein
MRQKLHLSSQYNFLKLPDFRHLGSRRFGLPGACVSPSQLIVVISIFRFQLNRANEMWNCQAGSYLLMDTLYVNRGSPFTRSLTMLATVISRPEPHRAVIDCGRKELSAERGLLEFKDTGAHPEIGQKLELWVHYSDATVNLHRRMDGVRKGEVEEIVQIEH